MPKKHRSAAQMLQKLCSAASHVCPACPAGISKQGNEVRLVAPVSSRLCWPRVIDNAQLMCLSSSNLHARAGPHSKAELRHRLTLLSKTPDH